VIAVAAVVLALVAIAWALRLRRRLALVARADHELRGSVTVLSLAAERLRRLPATRRYAAPLEVELQRLRTTLADLAAARRGRRAADAPALVELEPLARGAIGAWAPALRASGRRAIVDWAGPPATVRAVPGRLVQALSNLLANAVEHGEGTVELRGRPTRDGVRLEVRNAASARPARRHARDRGRGLGIASDAAEAAGGELRFESRDGAAVAAVELPAEGPDERARPAA
jgi:signal transduction histidine kinase